MGLEDKRKIAEEVLINSLSQLEDLFINDEQKEVYIDAMYGILGAFDGEISYKNNMLRVIENHKKVYGKRTTAPMARIVKPNTIAVICLN